VHNKKLIKSTGSALVLAVVAFLGASQGAQAATVVSGAIAANTTWSLANSPYEVTADVSVVSAATLTIEAGAIVYFDAGTNLTVSNGALVARGTAGQPIVFTSVLDTTGSTPAPGNWGQLRFLDGTNDSATLLEYDQIRFGQGINVTAASPTFNYLQITQNLGSAISIDLNSSPKGVGNLATGNSLNGISVPAGDVTGSVTWGIKGIPYVVSSGTVSVGASPTITSISPTEVQQSLGVDAIISGTRLTGADSIQFDSAGVSATLSAGGNDTSIPVHITASAAQPLGNVPFVVNVAAGQVRYQAGISVIALKPTRAVNSITPGSMRRAETKSFVIGGSYLLGAQVTVPVGMGLTLGNLLTTDTQASFDLTASSTATLGAQTISVSNPAIANGTGAMLVTINDALPRININSIPSAVLPDGLAHTYTLSLTNADTVDYTFNLSVLDPTIIGVSPATVTIPAGATSATINITGLKLGYTTLTISSTALASVSKQIYATNLLNGASVGPVLSAPVGVVMPYGTTLPLGTVVGPTLSSPVGVVMPYSQTSLPVGTVVGPTLSSPVGVVMPYSQTSLPVGTVVGPTVSAPVGVVMPYSQTTLPVGTAVGPILSAPVGVVMP
jgi:hypothetical protein